MMEAQEIAACQPKKYTCSHDKCGYQTNKLFNFQRHKKIHEKKAQLREMAAQAAAHGHHHGHHHAHHTHHNHIRDASPAAKLQRLDQSLHIECPQRGCPFTCDSMDDFTDHVQVAHDKEMRYFEKVFDDKESLEVFMKALQERTACSMTISRTFDVEVGESFELCCATSGRIRRAADGGVEPAIDRSGIYCTFYMHVTLVDKTIRVRGCETHFGHPVDLNIYNNNNVTTTTNNNNNVIMDSVPPATPSTPATTPTAALAIRPVNLQLLERQGSVKDELVASSTSPDSSSSRSSHSHNLSPMREDLDKMHVREDVTQALIPAADADRDLRSQFRRQALDLQTEAELFLESDSQLSEQEFRDIEKASTVILDILRRARSRPARPHHNNNNNNNNTITATPTTAAPAVPSHVSPLTHAPGLNGQLTAAILQNQHHLHQLQQALRESQLQRGLSGLPHPMPSLTNAALLLSAAAAQRQQQHQAAFGLGHSLHGGNVAASVLNSLASTIQQQQQQRTIGSPLLQAVHNVSQPPALPHNHHTAVVQPQPQVSADGGGLGDQNQRFDELVRKAIIELDAQRRSTCAHCHRKEPADGPQPTSGSWLDCAACQLKFHLQCVPDGLCVKCKSSLA